ncbi:MAG: nucleotidyltransferase [Planctomycetes bacterium]|nr:nucleotidyltransferase [Planctomycetota bacterium]
MRFYKLIMVMGILLTVFYTNVKLLSDQENPLFFDDFDQQGPLDAGKWKIISEMSPVCDSGRLISQPNKIWCSQEKFSEPVSIEFSGVFIAELPRSANNQIGLAPDGHGPDMVVWTFDGMEPKRLVPLRHVAGNDFWKEGYENAVQISNLPDITKTENGINLRIDWWPGKLVRYYINDKIVAEFLSNVPDVALPVGIRDETVYFRIGSIKVMRISQSADEILKERARVKEEQERLVKEVKEKEEKAKDEIILARIQTRIEALAKRFSKLRMVIGGPCYFWGIDAEIEHELKSAGMEVLCWPNAPLLDPEQSAQIGRDPMGYNVIIFGDSFYHLIQPDPNTGEIPKKITDQIPMLKEFLNAGGGIWFCGLGEQNWGRSSYALNYILKELNLEAEVIGEVVRDREKFKIGEGRFPEYAWADVIPDTLTKGVSNLLYPSSVISSEGSMGVVPIVKLSQEWRVLLKGKSTSASYPCVEGAIEGRLQDTPNTVKSSPVLCAVREAGKGRVVLWPTWSNFTVTGGSGGALIDGEVNGRFSDGAHLIENIICWLAEPSQNSKTVGTFDPQKHRITGQNKIEIDNLLNTWASVQGRKDYPSQFKGLIGAHSVLSDGKSSPEEMITAAKKSGYQFIAFTEDFSRMNEEKWKQLITICDRVNAEDSNFIVYPGLDFIDENGNRGLIFGNRYWVKDEWRSNENPDRIRWWYNLTYEADADAHRWPPRVIIHSKTNNKRPWNQGLWSFLGIYCYEDGKLIDDSFDEWQRLVWKNVFFLNTGIMTVHTVKNTEEITMSAKPGFYQTYVRADNLQQVISRLTGTVGTGAYFPSYVSAGPEVLDFRPYVAIVGGEESFDLANPENNRGLIHILVQSEAGLKEVIVYEGKRVVRRFLPEGKSFETYMTFHPDSHHAYTMVVTDKQDRRAVSWTAFRQIQEWVHRRCGDNWNWMRTGKGPGILDSPDLSYQLLELTAGWTSQKFIPGSERKEKNKLRGYKCEQGIYSHGGLSAAINGYIRLHGLIVEGKSWPLTYPAMTLDFATIGRFGTILTNTVREEMLVPDVGPYYIGAFAGPYKVISAPCPAELKQFIPFQKPDGASINRYAGKAIFLKEVRTADGNPVTLTLGDTGNPGANIVEVVGSDGSSKRHIIGDGSLSGEIPEGGYVCWYDDHSDGVGGIIAISPGVHFSYSKKWQKCFINLSSPVKSGIEVQWDVVFVTGNNSTTNSNAQMEDVRLGMGITGKPTLYEVKPRVGKVIDQKYFLTVESEDYGFSGKIVKTSEKPLPIHLPVFIQDVNPRWDAGIWYRGKTQLHTPQYYRDRWGTETWRWTIGSYEPGEDTIRYIPVLEDGNAYCQIDTDKQDPDIFIGNLLVCNQPKVFISLIRAEKGKCTFEVNNPTDKTITCTVRPSKGFDFTGYWEKIIALPAGATQKVTVGM